MTLALTLAALIVALAAAAALMWRADVHHERGRLEEADRNPFGALTYTRRANVALVAACFTLLAVVLVLIVVLAWIGAA